MTQTLITSVYFTDKVPHKEWDIRTHLPELCHWRNFPGCQCGQQHKQQQQQQ
jgi:hypothetical protein